MANTAKWKRKLSALAEKHGREVVQLNTGYFSLVDPNGGKSPIKASNSPKDADTALRQVERDLRRKDST